YHILMRQSFDTGEIMVSLVTKPAFKEEIRELGKVLAPLGVTSFWHTELIEPRNDHMRNTLILGKETIQDKIGDYVVQVSLHAFLQTNGLGITTLYNVIKDEVN